VPSPLQGQSRQAGTGKQQAAFAFVGGTPGALFAWGKAMIAGAAEITGAALDLCADIPVAAQPSGRLVVVHSEAPDADFAAAALRGSVSLLFLGDPAADLAFQQRVLAQPPLDSLRALTQSAATLCDMRAGALLIRQSSRPAAAVIQRVLAALGLPGTGPAAEAVIQRFAGPHAALPLAQAVEWYAAGHLPVRAAQPQDAPIAEAKAVQAILAPAYAAIATGEAGRIVWPRACFFDGDRPGAIAPPWIEVAGGARILFYGPYLHLPRGRWRLTVQLAFSDDLDKTSFSIEVVCGGIKARGRIKPAASGTFYAAFPFEHDTPAEPVEVRIATDHGSIFGRMALIDAAFTAEPAALVPP
jgi:hypothetical protein